VSAVERQGCPTGKRVDCLFFSRLHQGIMQTDPQPLPIGDVESLRILNALAEGVHPLTGHPLPDDSVYQHAKVLRALQSAIGVLKEQSQKKTKREGSHGQAGRPWTAAEIALLVQGFDSGMTIPQLAEKHRRTIGGIQSRLAKLGKVPPDPRWAAIDAEKREKKLTKLKREPLLPEKLISSQSAVNPSAIVPDGEIPY